MPSARILLTQFLFFRSHSWEPIPPTNSRELNPVHISHETSHLMTYSLTLLKNHSRTKMVIKRIVEAIKEYRMYKQRSAVQDYKDNNGELQENLVLPTLRMSSPRLKK